MSKETLTINITRRDRIYISIIAVLVVAVLVLAICLPRPYKTVEVEKPVVVKQNVYVYPTEHTYIINPNSALYDSVNQNYILSGDEYIKTEVFEYDDLDDCKQVQVSVIDNGQTITLGLENELVLQLVQKPTTSFSTNIVVSSELMNAVSLMFEARGIQLAVNEEFLFEIVFEESKVNIIVSYIGL